MIRLQQIFAILMLLAIANGNSYGQTSSEVSTGEIVKRVIEKGLQQTKLDVYAGSLLLHSISEFAMLKGNDSILQKVVGIYQKFGTGEIKATGNFISYEAGGSGAAYLGWKGVTDKLTKQVSTAADKMMQLQQRSSEGIMTAKYVTNDLVFIDVAFAVTPFYLYGGLAANNPDYIDYAAFETLELFKILKDGKTGLLHQARGFKGGVGNITEDNWSRGNGWGAFALAALARDLPATHPKRKEVIALAQQFFTSVLQYQNKEGLWHQEMSDPSSYVETSGSGLILYAIGIMLEKGLLNKKYLGNFKLGLRGYTSYIGSDGSVSNTCFSCMAPGKGTKADYKNVGWVYNDHHAFGAAVLAFTQAVKMGIDKIIPLKKMGYYSLFDSPKVPRTYAMHARGVDVSWENDRVGFRVYGGPAVRDKVRNGIDVWAKKVAYPMLETWYAIGKEDKDYHTDYGEGCDFYHMAKRLGCGAIAIWNDGKPYGPETYDGSYISKNQLDNVEVNLEYNTWNVPGIKLTEKKKIEMPMGTNLFKVTSTLASDQNIELTVAIGLSTFGKPEVYRDEKLGALSVWEKMDAVNGSMGTAVLVNKINFAGFASYQGDEYILVKVKTNMPFTYYAGAGWEKSRYFRKSSDWKKYVKIASREVAF